MNRQAETHLQNPDDSSAPGDSFSNASPMISAHDSSSMNTKVFSVRPPSPSPDDDASSRQPSADLKSVLSTKSSTTCSSSSPPISSDSKSATSQTPEKSSSPKVVRISGRKRKNRDSGSNRTLDSNSSSSAPPQNEPLFVNLPPEEYKFDDPELDLTRDYKAYPPPEFPIEKIVERHEQRKAISPLEWKYPICHPESEGGPSLIERQNLRCRLRGLKMALQANRDILTESCYADLDNQFAAACRQATMQVSYPSEGVLAYELLCEKTKQMTESLGKLGRSNNITPQMLMKKVFKDGKLDVDKVLSCGFLPPPVGNMRPKYQLPHPVHREKKRRKVRARLEKGNEEKAKSYNSDEWVTAMQTDRLNTIEYIINHENYPKEGVDFKQFIFHPTCYVQTVENIMDVTFLLHEHRGRLKLVVDDEGDIMVMKGDGPFNSGGSGGSTATAVESIIGFNYYAWEALCEAYNGEITEPLIFDRSELYKKKCIYPKLKAFEGHLFG